MIKSSGRSLHFIYSTLEQGEVSKYSIKILLAIIGLVYPEARFKFKNIDFRLKPILPVTVVYKKSILCIENSLLTSSSKIIYLFKKLNWLL
jgi:hypothetical protein